MADVSDVPAPARDALGLPVVGGVAAGGLALVALLVNLQFCGAIAMPAKPPPPRVDRSPERVAAKLGAKADVYLQTLARDARSVGVDAPTEEERGRPLRFARDDQRRVLRPGEPPVEVAGLRLSAVAHQPEGSDPLLSLQVENPGGVALAYQVDTTVSSNANACFNRTTLSHNGNVVAAGGRELRSECAYRRGMELYVNRVETAELSRLAALYLGMVPPQALGGPERTGKGHKPALPPGVVPCSTTLSQRTRAGLQSGAVQWRDLVDFYARHSCDAYQFPQGYKAFTTQGERPLPALE